MYRRRRFLTGKSDKNIAEFMGRWGYLRSKEFKKLGHLVHFHRREIVYPSHSAFSLSEALSEGCRGLGRPVPRPLEGGCVVVGGARS